MCGPRANHNSPADPDPHHRDQPGQARPGPRCRRHRLDRQALRPRKADLGHPPRGALSTQQPRRVRRSHERPRRLQGHLFRRMLRAAARARGAVRRDRGGRPRCATGSMPCSAPSTRSRAAPGPSASPALVGFAHAYETLLDHVRDGRIELTDDRRGALHPRQRHRRRLRQGRPDRRARCRPTMAPTRRQQFDALTRGERLPATRTTARRWTSSTSTSRR